MKNIELSDFIKKNLNGEQSLCGENLKKISEELFKFTEFDGVDNINILDFPIFGCDADGKPLSFVEDFLGDMKDNVQTVEEFNLGQNSIVLNDEIDIYSLELAPMTYEANDFTNLGCGVWLLPTMYDMYTFKPSTNIKIRFSREDIKSVKHLDGDNLDAYIKKTILNKVSELLDSKQSNIPIKQNVIIRCSNRSLNKNKTNEK